MAYASRLLLGAELAAELLALPRPSLPRVFGLVGLTPSPPGVEVRSMFNGRTWETAFARPDSRRTQAFCDAFRQAAKTVPFLEGDQVLWFGRGKGSAVEIHIDRGPVLNLPHLRTRSIHDAA